MINYSRMIMIGVLTTFTIVGPSRSTTPSSDEVVIFPEQGAVLSQSQIAELGKEAMNGSPEAAHRLAAYYALIKLDNKTTIFWTQIRVEDGDRDARYDLGAYLAVDKDPLSRLRARYWLKQVEHDGPPDLARNAQFALKSLDDQEKLENLP